MQSSSAYAAQNLAVVPIPNREAAIVQIFVLLAILALCVLARKFYFRLLLHVSRNHQRSYRLLNTLHRLNQSTSVSLVSIILLCLHLPTSLALTLCHTYKGDQCWNRLGWIAIAHIVIVVLLAIPYIPLLLPRPFIIICHKFLARYAILLVTTHMSLYLNLWISVDFISYQLERTIVRYGLVCWISIAFIFLLSLRPVRRKAYAVFWSSHRFLTLCLLIFIFLHRPATTGFTVFTLLLFCFSVLFQIYRLTMSKDHKQTITITLHSTLIKILIHMPNTQISILPGSYIYIMTPSHRIFMTPHPFTIAQHSYSPNTGTCFTLYVKPSPATTTTNWFLNNFNKSYTTHFYNTIKANNQLLPSPITSTQTTTNISLSFLGPFNSPLFDVFTTFDHLILVAGGIGITPWISWIEYFCQPNVKSKRIDLIWVVHSTDDLFHDFNQYPTKILTSVRTVTSQDLGRPDFTPLLAFESNAIGLSAVLVCGPASMVTSVRGAVKLQKQKLWIFEEVFLV